MNGASSTTKTMSQAKTKIEVDCSQHILPKRYWMD